MISRLYLRPIIALAVYSLMAFGSGSICWAQKTIAWKFKKDGVTNVLIEQDTSLQMENAGNATLATNHTQSIQTTNVTWTVREISPDGLASIEQMINRVQLDLKSSAGNFAIDTNDNKTLTGLGESVARGIRPLAGARFVVKTKPNGEVAEVIIPEDVSKKLSEGSGALSEAGLREIAVSGSLQFPAKPIEVGESWTSQYQLDMPPFGKLTVSTTYQYLGEENGGGKVLDRIKATTAVKVADATNNAGLKLMSQESGGMIWFDTTRGTIDHSEFKQEMTLNVVRTSVDPTKPALDLKQVMKQIMKLKYTPQL